MRDHESGSVQGLAAFFIIVIVFAILWIMLSPMVDAFMNSPNSMVGMPLSFERADAIASFKTTWWLWPLVVLALGGLYYWKEAIMKRSGEV